MQTSQHTHTETATHFMKKTAHKHTQRTRKPCWQTVLFCKEVMQVWINPLWMREGKEGWGRVSVSHHIPLNSARKYTDENGPRAAWTRLQLDWNRPEGRSSSVTDMPLAPVPLILHLLVHIFGFSWCPISYIFTAQIPQSNEIKVQRVL